MILSTTLRPTAACAAGAHVVGGTRDSPVTSPGNEFDAPKQDML